MKTSEQITKDALKSESLDGFIKDLKDRDNFYKGLNSTNRGFWDNLIAFFKVKMKFR